LVSAPSQSALQAEAEARLRFEMLLADVCAQFVNVAPSDADSKIENAQRVICESLGVDHSSVWQVSAEKPDLPVMTHVYRDPNLTPLPLRPNVKEYFPWSSNRILNKEIVCVSNTATLPPEATKDKESWEQYGIHSSLIFPLSVAGGLLIGVLAFDNMEARDWSESLQRRLQILAHVFAQALDRKNAERKVRESEDKLRLLLDSTAEAIYGIDLEHRCTFCNPACLRTLGYGNVDEVLGKNMHDLLHHTRADGILFPVEECRVHRVTRTGEGVHAEDVFWRANGTSFPAEYWSYPQRRGEEVVGAVVAFIDITERKLAEAALTNVSSKLIEAQEQERARIGRELHDDIGQRLALLAIELQQLHENPVVLPEVRSRMGKFQKQISEIAADIQSLSHELHSSKLQYLGIAGAMRGFCREFGEQQKVEIDFQTHDVPSPLSPDISLCFFRVLQESLHNSAKHSGVRHFEVRLWGTSDEIHLTVVDSGAGFDRDGAKTSQGLGLISMEERLKLLNGTLSIESQPQRGTTIHARVPLSAGSDSIHATGEERSKQD
jgi:PAS domain S-box-containing protein